MHQEVDKELTLEQQYGQKLNFSIRQYRSSVRWLREARIYASIFADENWKGPEEAEVAQDSRKAYKEAVASVLYWRKQVNKYNELLIKLANKKKV